MIKTYLDGGDRDGFGARNPFDNFSGEGGTEGLAKALAVDVKTSDCPNEDTRFSAMLFGKLVGASAISAEDRMIVQMFMEVAYEDNVTAFNKGLSMIKAVARAAAVVETTGAHGGKVPTDAEAILIADKKGMSWQQVVAISSVLFSGTVPTLAEIEIAGGVWFRPGAVVVSEGGAQGGEGVHEHLHQVWGRRWLPHDDHQGGDAPGSHAALHTRGHAHDALNHEVEQDDL
jgi:hypothetical protein